MDWCHVSCTIRSSCSRSVCADPHHVQLREVVLLFGP